MARDANDWNYDRIQTAQAQIVDVQNDMMRCLYKGKIYDVVRDRMVTHLRDAADDIAKLKLCHSEEE